MQIGLGSYLRNTSLGRYSQPDCELVYVPIHKNAHTWGVEFFSVNYGFEKIKDITVERQNHLKYIVFLRDPMKRWFSGAAQFLVNNFYTGVSDDLVEVDDKILHTMFSAVRIDPHTDLQRAYVTDLNIMHVHFFNIDEEMFYLEFTQWLDAISDYFNLRKLNKDQAEHVVVQPTHLTTESILKTKLVQILRDFLDKNPRYLLELKSYYKPDYELLDYMYKFNYSKKLIYGRQIQFKQTT